MVHIVWCFSLSAGAHLFILMKVKKVLMLKNLLFQEPNRLGKLTPPFHQRRGKYFGY